MLIAGLQKLTLIDYPGKIAATVFTFGCNFLCSFCHNPELVDTRLKNQNIFWSKENFFEFLEKRRKLIEGVCITGGEPTIHHDLPEFISQIKKLRLLVKLDTNGTNSGMVSDLINKNLVDYLAMDLKAPLERYEELVRRRVDLKEIQESIKIILGSNRDYEFRSTLVPGFHTAKDIEAMAQLIRGAKNYYLQNFVSQGKMLDPTWQTRRSFTLGELESFQAIAREWVENCWLRN